MLLRLLYQYIGPGMSYSFGGSEHDNSVLPHIAFPVKQAMQHVVVTPAGSDPPRLGQPFIESDESRRQRKADADRTNDFWDLDSTYSMSFASSCVDLPTWRILYPRSIALSTFWGNSPLRLVVYERDGGDKIGNNKYLFSLQVEFLGFPADQRATTLNEGKEIKQEVILGDKNLIS